MFYYLLSYGIEVGIGTGGVEDLVAVHDGDEVVGVREVDDVVRVAGEHGDGSCVQERQDGL